MLNHARRTAGRPSARRQGGVAAVEFALILPILIAMIGLSIFFAKVLMYYTVAEKAAQGAAIYLASVPLADIDNTQRSDASVDVTQWMADEMMGAMKSGALGNTAVQVQCDGHSCGFGVPKEITVITSVRLFDEYFSAWTAPLTGRDGIVLHARVTVPYLGK